MYCTTRNQTKMSELSPIFTDKGLIEDCRVSSIIGVLIHVCIFLIDRQIFYVVHLPVNFMPKL